MKKKILLLFLLIISTFCFIKNTKAEENKYSIEYLLTNYQIVSYENAKIDTHCMGSVLVGGDISGTGSGICDGNIGEAYPFIKGTWNGNPLVPNSRSNNPKIPVYIGTSNTSLEGTGNKDYTFVLSDDYYDFDAAWKEINSEIDKISTLTKTVEIEGNYGTGWSTRKVSLNEGDYITVELSESNLNYWGAFDIAMEDFEDPITTIITITDSGTVNVPFVLINGTQQGVSEDGSGCSIIWVFPNATEVILPTESWIGHVVAPNAIVKQNSANYNGGIIAKEVNTSGEGHLYPYNGGKITPEDPEDPEDPKDPEDPEDPSDPEDPEDPKDPKDPKEEVKINKLDEDGEFIDGAELSILKDSKVIYSWTSDLDEEIVYLEVGTYVLHEETAPEGFEIALDITFKIDEDGTVYILNENEDYEEVEDNTIIMIDEIKKMVLAANIEENPNTNANIPIILILCLALGTITIIVSKRDKKIIKKYN